MGDSARRVRDLARRKGHEADIFALSIDAELVDEIRPFTDPAARAGDITVLHFAVPSPMTEALTTLRGRRVLQYHNITPAHFFAPYDAGIFRIAALGRTELRSLAGRVDLALGDSEYNRAELEALGFADTGVFPILVDPERLTRAPRQPVLERALDDGPANILFVGRVAPNKKLEDHIRLAEHYKRYVDTDYRFIFVGRTDAVPRYYATLQSLMLQYEMPAERFLFTGAVPDVELATCYRTASAYVSLSEHEGFCVPLLEAMACGVPVVTSNISSLPEVAGDAAVLVDPRDEQGLAGAIARLLRDEALRGRLREAGIARAREFSWEATARRTLDAYAAVVQQPMAQPRVAARAARRPSDKA